VFLYIGYKLTEEVKFMAARTKRKTFQTPQRFPKNENQWFSASVYWHNSL